MKIRIKPLVAGAAVGAALAAGGIAAIDLGSEPAEAQNGGPVTQSDLKAANERSQAAIRKANTIQNDLGRYFLPKGGQIGANQPPGVIRPKPGTGGGGLPTSALSENTQENFPYWVQIWHDGNTTFWVSRGATNVERVAAGNYLVTWGKNVVQCSSNITIGNIGTFDPPNGHGLAQSRWSGSQTTTRYRTWSNSGANNPLVDADYPITAQLVCNDATATNLN